MIKILIRRKNSNICRKHSNIRKKNSKIRRKNPTILEKLIENHQKFSKLEEKFLKIPWKFRKLHFFVFSQAPNFHYPQPPFAIKSVILRTEGNYLCFLCSLSFVKQKFHRCRRVEPFFVIPNEKPK